jgi:hypothetical protein
MPKYTFTFDQHDERIFNDIMSRLEDTEYTVLRGVELVDPKNPRTSQKSAILETDSESALTFRMGMKNVKIEREKSEEEIAKRKALEDSKKITVNVAVPGLVDPNTTQTP